MYLRKVERLNDDGTWTQVRLFDLKKGDRFRMSGDDLCEEGKVYTASSDGYPCDFDGRHSVQAELDRLKGESVNGGILVDSEPL